MSTEYTVTLDFKPVQSPPSQSGWFIGALLPAWWQDESLVDIANWQSDYGTVVVWYNPDSTDRWWTPDPHGNRSTPVGHLITHWAEMPLPPVFDGQPRPALPGAVRGYAGENPYDRLVPEYVYVQVAPGERGPAKAFAKEAYAKRRDCQVKPLRVDYGGV